MKSRDGLNPNWLLTEWPQMRQVTSLSLGFLNCKDKEPRLLGALNELAMQSIQHSARHATVSQRMCLSSLPPSPIPAQKGQNPHCCCCCC